MQNISMILLVIIGYFALVAYLKKVGKVYGELSDAISREYGKGVCCQLAVNKTIKKRAWLWFMPARWFYRQDREWRAQLTWLREARLDKPTTGPFYTKGMTGAHSATGTNGK